MQTNTSGHWWYRTWIVTNLPPTIRVSLVRMEGKGNVVIITNGANLDQTSFIPSHRDKTFRSARHGLSGSNLKLVRNLRLGSHPPTPFLNIPVILKISYFNICLLVTGITLKGGSGENCTGSLRKNVKKCCSIYNNKCTTLINSWVSLISTTFHRTHK